MALKFKLHFFLGVASFHSCRWLVKVKAKAFLPFCSFNEDFYPAIPPHLEEPATELSDTAGFSQWPTGADSAMLQGGLMCQTSMCIPAAPSCYCPWTKLAQSQLFCKQCHQFAEDRPRMVHLERSPTCLHCCFPPPQRGATQSSVSGFKGGNSSLSPTVCISGGSERGRSLFWLLLCGRGLQLQLPLLTLC